MSSVTRFLKQVTPGLNVLAPPLLAHIYEFVPSSSNYVGNYPPGGMVQASGDAALTAYLTVAGGLYPEGTVAAGVVARDMGKTIKASIATTPANAAASTFEADTENHFRMIQLLRPKAGNVDGAFGVQGSNMYPNQYTDYVTVYVPVCVVYSGGLVSASSVLVGGQM
jgi:hypothetical protein